MSSGEAFSADGQPILISFMEYQRKKIQRNNLSKIFAFVLLFIMATFFSSVDLWASTLSQVSGEVCGQITVRWGKVEGAEEYELYRGDELIYRGKNNEYIDSGLVLGRSYPYRLRASNRAGKSPFSPTVHLVARNLCTPDKPDNLFVHSYPCGGKTLVHWDSVPRAERYELRRGGTVIYSGDLTYFFDSNLRFNWRYSYTVRAWNSSGWGKEVSISGRSSDRCPPFVPDKPFADRAESGTEGDMSISLRTAPRDGVRVRTSADVISFNVTANHSDMTIRRIDVFFDKDPRRYMDKVEIKLGTRVVASIPVNSETVSVISRDEYRLRLGDLFLEVKDGRTTALTVRVTRKPGPNYSQYVKVYLKNNSIRVEDTLFISYTLPTAGGGITGDFSRRFIVN